MNTLNKRPAKEETGGIDGAEPVSSADVSVPRRRQQDNIFASMNPEQDLFDGYDDEGFSNEELLERLIERMKTCYDWRNDPSQLCFMNDNQKIPAGYTYLAQLAAHDLLQNLAPLPRVDDRPGSFARDFRSSRLLLDTVYGGGPETHPSLYAIEGSPNNQRCRFRLGQIRPATPPVSPHRYPRPGAPALDIPRAACPFLNDSPGPGAPDVLIADPRNDDHVIISQMTALFHRFHNAVYDRLAREFEPSNDSEVYRLFLASRRVVTHTYRAIVKHDLLERLLDRRIYDYYLKAEHPQDFLSQVDSGLVPLEFSHAAYRIGHVMIRFGYRINDQLNFVASIKQVLDQSSSRRPDKMPLADDWVVDWAHFFELDSAKRPNLSRRIEPYIRGDLSGASHFKVSGRPGQGLFFRDLLRGAKSGLLTVDALIAKVNGSPLDGLHDSEITKDAEKRRAALETWLTDPAAGVFQTGKSDTSIITRHPPLFLYLLFEAAHDAKGEHYGVLGSTILAEVFFSALAMTEHRVEGAEKIDDLLDIVFNDERPQKMPELFGHLRKLLSQPL